MLLETGWEDQDSRSFWRGDAGASTDCAVCGEGSP